MYLTNIKNVVEKLSKTEIPFTIVRGYFCETSYRIIRSQDSSYHDQAKLDPISNLDRNGSYKSFDYWNTYSFELIEQLVRANSKTAEITWFDDVKISNRNNAMTDEEKFGVPKRGGTETYNGMEISFPFIQPWKFLVIRWR